MSSRGLAWPAFLRSCPLLSSTGVDRTQIITLLQLRQDIWIDQCRYSPVRSTAGRIAADVPVSVTVDSGRPRTGGVVSGGGLTAHCRGRCAENDDPVRAGPKSLPAGVRGHCRAGGPLSDTTARPPGGRHAFRRSVRGGTAIGRAVAAPQGRGRGRSGVAPGRRPGGVRGRPCDRGTHGRHRGAQARRPLPARAGDGRSRRGRRAGGRRRHGPQGPRERGRAGRAGAEGPGGDRAAGAAVPGGPAEDPARRADRRGGRRRDRHRFDRAGGLPGGPGAGRRPRRAGRSGVRPRHGDPAAP